jgi:hypothetical protein
MKDYIHRPILEPQGQYPFILPARPDFGVGKTREEIIPYGQRDVIVTQMVDAGGTQFVVVPGAIKDKHYRQEDGSLVSVVDEIKETEQKELEGIIKEKGFEGPVNFW